MLLLCAVNLAVTFLTKSMYYGMALNLDKELFDLTAKRYNFKSIFLTAANFLQYKLNVYYGRFNDCQTLSVVMYISNILSTFPILQRL